MSRSPAALVTGCSSGIGRATAIALVKAGIPTWASARRLDTIQDLAAAGCRLVQLDVTDEESRVRAVKAVEAEHGAIGTLVNNAGYAQAGPIEEVPLDLVRRQFETNVYGLIRMCQLALPNMRTKGGGTIVNIGSAAGLMGVPATGTYAMSKWSVEALSDALRYEVRDFGVRVVVLEPGGVITTGFAATEHETWPAGSGPYEKFRQNHRARMAGWTNDNARGMSTPDQVARVVVRAATATRPRARYKVGVAPRLMPVMYRLLPTSMWDGFWARQFPVT
ncbi:SDR family NAD(P)-dependent oxidoreductase [Fodinicola feengrottensis]|uniref:Oxidoreductase n=1 Tax=Fodinicola feengrottensis TaxID=435914 RepID=A0ABN2I1L0_9ACTN|nr:SDR family NAD(P)-dependent oxidoreductase [Fodinicola feengrottensis]